MAIALCLALPLSGCGTLAMWALRPDADPIPPVEISRYPGGAEFKVPSEAYGFGGPAWKKQALFVASIGTFVLPFVSLLAMSPLIAVPPSVGAGLGLLMLAAGIPLAIGDVLYASTLPQVGRPQDPVSLSVLLRAYPVGEPKPGQWAPDWSVDRIYRLDLEPWHLDLPLTLVAQDSQGREVIRSDLRFPKAAWQGVVFDDDDDPMPGSFSRISRSIRTWNRAATPLPGRSSFSG